jgi:hypothetical protein
MIAPTLALALALSAPKADGDWKPLFDGKTLDGWQHVGPGKFTVEDGALKAEGGMGLLWYTKETFGDCVIRVVYKVSSPQSNGGVFIRIADKPKDPWFGVHHGFEVQVLGSEGPDAYHRTGSVYSLAPAKKAEAPVGQWNTMEITLKGNKVLVSVNGTPVTDFDPSGPVPERTKDYEPERGPRPTKGYVGVQNHHGGAGTEVYYKDVSVRPL